MSKKKSTIKPFESNADWMRWTDENCRKCAKDCSSDEDKRATESNCDIEEVLGIAYIVDEIPKAIADRAGLPDCERCKEFEFMKGVRDENITETY